MNIFNFTFFIFTNSKKLQAVFDYGFLALTSYFIDIHVLIFMLQLRRTCNIEYIARHIQYKLIILICWPSLLGNGQIWSRNINANDIYNCNLCTMNKCTGGCGVIQVIFPDSNYHTHILTLHLNSCTHFANITVEDVQTLGQIWFNIPVIYLFLIAITLQINN